MGGIVDVVAVIIAWISMQREDSKYGMGAAPGTYSLRVGCSAVLADAKAQRVFFSANTDDPCPRTFSGHAFFRGEVQRNNRKKKTKKKKSCDREKRR